MGRLLGPRPEVVAVGVAGRRCRALRRRTTAAPALVGPPIRRDRPGGVVVGRGRSRGLLHVVSGNGLPRPQSDPAGVRGDAAVHRPALSALAGGRSQAQLPARPAAGGGRSALLPLVRAGPHGGDEPDRPHRPARRRAPTRDSGPLRPGDPAHRRRRMADQRPPTRGRRRGRALLRRRRVQLHRPRHVAVRDAGDVRRLARHVDDLQLGAAAGAHRLPSGDRHGSERAPGAISGWRCHRPRGADDCSPRVGRRRAPCRSWESRSPSPLWRC